MRRGEVWRGLVFGRSERTVVIVGHDRVTAGRSEVLCAHISDGPDLQDSLLTIPIRQPVEGYIRAVTIGPLSKQWLTEQLGHIDEPTQEQLDIALRAALNL